MENFIVLYGKTVIWFILIISILLGAVKMLRYGWQRYGVATDHGKMDWEQSIFSEEPPVLDVSCRKVSQGDVIRTEDMATAYDAGENISQKIHFFDETGREVSGQLETEFTGEYYFEVVVKSDRTGKEVRKKIVLLVDGKV